MSDRPYYLVADGACRGNPGPGGWGLIVVTPAEEVFEFGGYDPDSTNNRMELMGFYRGLQEVHRRGKDEPGKKIIHAISDSKYVLDGVEKYVRNWVKNGWKTSTGSDVKNKDIWEKILKGLDTVKKHGFVLEYELVKGHSGNDANERVDQIAVRYSREEPIDLYTGPLSRYPVKIETGTPFEVVYLSYIDGVLVRHKTWDECQKATSGKPGAKFKKVKNRVEEREALRLWGLE